jgi:hypothetical protein
MTEPEKAPDDDALIGPNIDDENIDDAGPGDHLVLVRIGLAYGDRLGTWDAAGTSLIWRVPDELADLVGRASLPRTDLGGGISGEVVIVDQLGRAIRAADDRQWAAELLLEAAGPADNVVFTARLRRIVLEAARRGESVIVAIGGLAEFDQPAARASVVQDDGGDWVTVVEAFPPLAVGPWADAEQDDAAARVTLPADDRGIHDAAVLLLTAAATFTRGPELVGLYFESAPDGAWPG